jgi:beta-lactamase superfamily II metal-dependent hydrolase
MYRQGLGDLFLITMPGPEKPFHMLIDCGVILGTKNPETIMGQVVADLRAATDDHLDVVVATHEHWDHLSGFVQARDAFDKIAVGEVWFAWTEDPDHPLARTLRREREQRRAGLVRALGRLREVGASPADVLGVQELLGFFGPLSARAAGTADALAYLARRGRGALRYLRPGGAAIELPGVPGVRIYVLGPPEDAKQIRKSDPTRSGREVYDLTSSPTPEGSFLSVFADKASGDEWEEIREKSCPFEERLRITPAAARRLPFFRERYGFGRADASEWRRIDGDWLAVAGELALALDGDTNNTSLVLAIELVSSGRVILMAADAQVGNWESWSGHSWQVKGADGSATQVSGDDLLQRTVLYKVGHHGSHNATLREKGLERMNSPELVAMIPVNEEMARVKRWNMPFPALLRRLEERTKGRVLRADSGIPGTTGLSAAARREFDRHAAAAPLYVEYRVPM